LGKWEKGKKKRKKFERKRKKKKEKERKGAENARMQSKVVKLEETKAKGTR
jgi:hypothetical protein